MEYMSGRIHERYLKPCKYYFFLSFSSFSSPLLFLPISTPIVTMPLQICSNGHCDSLNMLHQPPESGQKAWLLVNV
ncbi:hypothetical protein PHAVU_008G160600 [Phaseolus vulgaris]|uniref:Uncharacterized protein n=1 Tax=Phaseolus vulgaris TaxID=3885 RepID=V7B5B7_PHAVU|nr:hypothetical protein PHAVU_008G160600g [Phaseolus vulgaris]ESW13014.1 hypothetical protein PHAVU_008G160600g [Phaseolus vulgaris]